MLGIITAIVMVVGMGTVSLFKGEEINEVAVDAQGQIMTALSDYPTVRYSYSPAKGTLLLLGHVLSGTDRSQILYNLESLPFVKSIDNNIVIDELVWQEANQVLSKNPAWRSITITSAEPGRFVLTGYLKTQDQAEQLSDYISVNFPYPELLEKRVVVEQDIISSVQTRLQENRITEVATSFANGELTLDGVVGSDKFEAFDSLVTEFEGIFGVQTLRNFVVKVKPTETLIDLTDEYDVAGSSNVDGVAVNVVINGRILAKGDKLDGMTITDINDREVVLERDGFKYRIRLRS